MIDDDALQKLRSEAQSNDDIKTFQLQLAWLLLSVPSRMDSQDVLNALIQTTQDLCILELSEEKAATYLYGALLLKFPDVADWYGEEATSEDDTASFEDYFGDENAGQTH